MDAYKSIQEIFDTYYQNEQDAEVVSLAEAKNALSEEDRPSPWEAFTGTIGKMFENLNKADTISGKKFRGEELTPEEQKIANTTSNDMVDFILNNLDFTGTFVGPKSTGWLDSMAEAFDLQKAGANKSEVYRKTGIFRSPYPQKNRLRKEISDANAKLQVAEEDFVNHMTGELDGPLSNLRLPMDAVLKHDELYKEYPGLKNIGVVFKPDKLKGAASYFENADIIEIGIKGGVPSPTELKEIFIHEIQHGIQDIEGFAKGGSPEAVPALFEDLFKTELDTLFNKDKNLFSAEMKFGETTSEYQKYLKRRAAHNIYRRFAGEIESREAAKRANWTIKDLLENPPTFEGITPEHAIVGY
jgi:hypothetical protein